MGSNFWPWDWQEPSNKTTSQQPDAVPLYPVIIPISEVSVFKLKKGFKYFRWRHRLFFLMRYWLLRLSDKHLRNLSCYASHIWGCTAPIPSRYGFQTFFKPPPPKLSKTGVKHAQRCLSLWLLHVGNWKFQNAQQLSVQVNCLSWLLLRPSSSEAIEI